MHVHTQACMCVWETQDQLMRKDLYSLWEMTDKDEGNRRVKNGVK